MHKKRPAEQRTRATFLIKSVMPPRWNWKKLPVHTHIKSLLSLSLSGSEIMRARQRYLRVHTHTLRRFSIHVVLLSANNIVVFAARRTLNEIYSTHWLFSLSRSRLSELSEKWLGRELVFAQRINIGRSPVLIRSGRRRSLYKHIGVSKINLFSAHSKQALFGVRVPNKVHRRSQYRRIIREI